MSTDANIKTVGDLTIRHPSFSDESTVTQNAYLNGKLISITLFYPTKNITKQQAENAIRDVLIKTNEFVKSSLKSDPYEFTIVNKKNIKGKIPQPEKIIIKEVHIPPEQASAEVAKTALAFINKNSPVNELHGVKTWEMTIDGQKHQINEFSPGSYNGPKTEDFIDRQSLLYEAALEHINTIKNNDKAVKALEKLNQAYIDAFSKSEYQVDIEIMRKADKGTDKHFKEKHTAAEKLLAQFAVDIKELIRKTTPPRPNGSLFNLNDLKQLEKEVVTKRGRPTIINFYEVDGEKFVSMQEPAKKGEFLPSTVRNREGLPNYVLSSFGVVNKNSEITIEYQGIRHSSLPPIAEKDSTKRQAIACRNEKQLVLDLAIREKGEKAVKKSSENNPVKVSLRTMMLLTPKMGDSLLQNRDLKTGEWKGESETVQLHESALAINMFRNRVFKAELEGQTVYLEADLSFMNLGANTLAARMGLEGKVPAPALEREINARGFEEFNDDCMTYFNTTAMSNAHLYQLQNQLKEAWNTPRVQKAKKQIKSLEDNYRTKLNQKYDKLEKLHDQYIKTNKGKAEIAQCQKEIAELEKHFTKAYVELSAAKKEAYKKVANLELKIRSESSKIDHAVSETYGSYFQALDLFYNDKTSQKETLMSLQTIYLDLNNKMKKPVSKGCKSAEDRTGRVNNLIEELRILRLLIKKYSYKLPNGIQKEIARIVAQASASRNNTRENSNATGLQISGDINPPETLAASNRLTARLAKKIYDRARKIKHPSPILLNILSTHT